MRHESVGSSALSEQRIFQQLELGVEYILGSKVIGSIAEFGSHGRSAAVICKKLAEFRSKRIVHLFDSFQGFPRATKIEDINSPHVRSGVWPEGGSKSPNSPEHLRRLLRRFLPDEQVKIYAGWFKDTLKNIPFDSTFALINMDCDLYESTYEVLAYAFEHSHISEGCIILFDDWNCNQASPKYGERRAWKDVTARFVVEYSDGGDYGWAGHKFTVHSSACVSHPLVTIAKCKE